MINGWAVGANGTILFNNGVHWAKQSSGSLKSLDSVKAINKQFTYICSSETLTVVCEFT